MAPSRWPLANLRLQTPGLELRWPSPEDLGALAELAALGVHDPEVQPFLVAWTDASPDERARSTMQYHWSRWGSWQPSDWTLELVVIRDGVVVGSQGVSGRDFAVLREVSTGSWLGRHYQGRGIGTQMRAAVLHLAFEGAQGAARRVRGVRGQRRLAERVAQARVPRRRRRVARRARPLGHGAPAAPDAGRLARRADDPGADPRPGALPAPFRAAVRDLTGDIEHEEHHRRRRRPVALGVNRRREPGPRRSRADDIDHGQRQRRRPRLRRCGRRPGRGRERAIPRGLTPR